MKQVPGNFALRVAMLHKALAFPHAQDYDAAQSVIDTRLGMVGSSPPKVAPTISRSSGFNRARDYFHMLLPPNQKPHRDRRLGSDKSAWNGSQRDEVDRSETGTARFAELSKLSARMVELSLQNQRGMPLSGPIPSKLTQGSWPFLLPCRADQSIVQPPDDNAGRPGPVPRTAGIATATHPNPQPAHETPRELRNTNIAALYSRATVILREMTNYRSSSVFRNLRDYWKSVQNDDRLLVFRKHIHGLFTVAAQRTHLIRKSGASLIGRWSSRKARTVELLADRISAKLQILRHSQPSQYLRHSCRKLLMQTTALAPAVCAVIKKMLGAKRYRCRDCGREVGFRSQPCNLVERFILPLLLMRPVRCARCFRRDYRLILTPVLKRSPHHDETVDPIHRNAA